ncbi:hypothetical protein ASPWEDRAFT_117780 [Aspergillus wentii DTO 134E9]|uniref:BHLH domain-containing protein n=1 Tax=Aspergillus wentii DTO 134E9 TaxID=1073089 RepID=A0A1L9RBX1_ASPWE|nr:uncharacterized protein ASPWEDRAFT_117780 [Aspergillus wentii DTO 134E9]OJJ32363.1 hypothetical protein ASPWEDRAFT_117780 [Aspergillus wentii DTO 134E9]
MDTPYEPAPAPPPGPALLDDNESNMLDNFFTTMNSNHFSNDLWLRGQQNKHLGGGFNNFEWSNELPPTFEGSTTSLSQPTHSHRGLEKAGGDIMGNNAGASSDILAAASMLYQNGMNAPEFTNPFNHQPFAGNTFSEMNGNSSNMNGHGKNLQHSNHASFKQPNAPFRARLPSGFHTSEMLFDVHQPMSADQQASAKVRPLHWGSDISFMDQGYIAPADQPNEEERTKELLDNLECLEPQSSAANTRAPSPDRMATGHHMHWAGSNTSVSQNDIRNGYGNTVEDDLQPIKRRKTLVKEEDDENSDADGNRPKSRRSKGPGYSKTRRGSNDTFRKSRMSQGAKSARENLTEDQKRSNHILSEQKRRNLIRQGFDEMCSLVPGLRGGGFSKSAMLTQAADWLEDTIRGNEILRAQLADLKAVNGLVMPR